MDLVHTILSLHKLRWRARRIARELGIHRETVARHIRLAAEGPKPATQAPSGSGASAKPATQAPTGSAYPLGRSWDPSKLKSGSNGEFIALPPTAAGDSLVVFLLGLRVVAASAVDGLAV